MKTNAAKKQTLEHDQAQTLVPQPGGGLAFMLHQAAELENQILVLAQENDGEIDAHLDTLLADLQKHITTKVDAYKFVMDRLETTAEMLDTRADEIYRAAKALLTAKESMKERLKLAMQGLKVKELAGQTWRFKLGDSKGTILIDGPTLDTLTASVNEAVLSILNHAGAYHAKHKAADAGGAGAELKALSDAVEKLHELDATGLGPYVKAEVTVRPLKDKIREALEAGTPVVGAEIEPGHTLRPYVNKVGA